MDPTKFRWLDWYFPGADQPWLHDLERLVPPMTGWNYLPWIAPANQTLYDHFIRWVFSGGQTPTEYIYRDLRAAILPGVPTHDVAGGIDWLFGALPNYDRSALFMLTDLLGLRFLLELEEHHDALTKFTPLSEQHRSDLLEQGLVRAVWGTTTILGSPHATENQFLGLGSVVASQWAMDLRTRYRWAIWAHAWPNLLQEEGSCRYAVKRIHEILAAFIAEFTLPTQFANGMKVCPPISRSDVKAYGVALSRIVARTSDRPLRQLPREFLLLLDWIATAMLGGWPTCFGSGGFDRALDELTFALATELLGPLVEMEGVEQRDISELLSHVYREAVTRYVPIARRRPRTSGPTSPEGEVQALMNLDGRWLVSGSSVFVGRSDGALVRFPVRRSASATEAVAAVCDELALTPAVVSQRATLDAAIVTPGGYLLRKLRRVVEPFRQAKALSASRPTATAAEDVTSVVDSREHSADDPEAQHDEFENALVALRDSLPQLPPGAVRDAVVSGLETVERLPASTSWRERIAKVDEVIEMISAVRAAARLEPTPEFAAPAGVAVPVFQHLGREWFDQFGLSVVLEYTDRQIRQLISDGKLRPAHSAVIEGTKRYLFSTDPRFIALARYFRNPDELARALGMSKGHMNKLLRGRTGPSIQGPKAQPHKLLLEKIWHARSNGLGWDEHEDLGWVDTYLTVVERAPRSKR